MYKHIEYKFKDNNGNEHATRIIVTSDNNKNVEIASDGGCNVELTSLDIKDYYNCISTVVGHSSPML